MINKVILIGNLGRDPEVRRLESGVAVAKFSIATNESYRDKNTGEWQKLTEWHDVVAWRYQAEMAERDLKKGKMVYVEGKLTHRKYQDKDGNDRYITEVVANTLRLLERREGGSSFNSSFPTEAPASVQANTEINTAPPVQPNDAVSETSAATEAGDDDLPF